MSDNKADVEAEISDRNETLALIDPLLIAEGSRYRGELPRGDAANIVGTGDRQARRIVSALVDKGMLTSESARAPQRVAFPAALASRWLPALFPERTA
jgi:hypothetical protein